VAIAASGDIYFTDAAGNGNGVIGRLTADLLHVEEVFSGPDFSPRGIAFTPAGTLAVADAASSQVLQYDLQGHALAVLAPANGCSDAAGLPGVSCDPADVAYSGNELLVLYRFTSVLRSFSGTSVKTLMGTPYLQGLHDGTSGALLDRPLGLALAPDGTVLIADTRNNRLRRLER
jgi:sugar lactone lactonase YvrE